MRLYVNMFRTILLLMFTLVIHEIKSSLVTDSLGQEGVLYSDYCPKSEHCEEGAHVMCMYYDPKRRYGPRCHNPRNVTVTEEIVLTILEITNAVRSKAAQGLETGRNNVPLPRAYGMMRLNWDSELATFAQISVDRCHLRHDLCRATKRFPNPAQVGSLFRFLYPSWKYVPNDVNLEKNLKEDGEDLTHAKVMQAVKKPLRNFFLTKQLVVPDMIVNYPDFEKTPKLINAAAYLNMVHAASTHVGCALSGYTEFILSRKNKKQNPYYNVVAMMCNFSAQPPSGSVVYNTTRPTKPGYSVRCGCPPGTVEDEDCLCNEKATETRKTRKKCRSNCSPPVLILPIFQIEDAPPSKLLRSTESKTWSDDHKKAAGSGWIQKAEDHIWWKALGRLLSSCGKKNEKIQSNLSVIPNKPTFKTIFEIPGTGKVSRKSHTNGVLDDIILGARIHSQISHPKNFSSLVRNHYYRKKCMTPNIHLPRISRPSIFSRSSIFELPVKKESNPLNAVIKNVTKSVIPRKNFTYAKNLLSSYMNKSRKAYKTLAKLREENPIIYEITTEIIVNKTDKTNNASYHKKYSTNYEETKSDETGDEKLLNLLDNLEQEISHIELHGDKIELIDAKIREIQDTIVGKPDAVILELDRPKIEISPNYESEVEHKHGSTLEQVQHVDIYRSKYNNDHIRRQSSIEDKTNERNKYSIFDVNQNTKNGLSTVKTRFSNNNEYDFRPVSDDKISHSPIHRRENQRYTELRKHNGNAEHRIHYGRKNKQVYDKKHDGHEAKVWNNKYNTEVNFKHRHSRERDKIGLYAHEMFQDNDDDLSSDRKAYYHNKLEQLRKKIQNARYQKEVTERLRPIKIPHTSNEMIRRPSKSPQNPLYIQDRARVVHGF